MVLPQEHLQYISIYLNENRELFSFKWEYNLFEFDEDEIFLNNENLNDRLKNLIHENPEKMLRCFKLFLMVECKLDYKLLQKHKYKLSYNNPFKINHNTNYNTNYTTIRF